jgi:hypothetical protein
VVFGGVPVLGDENCHGLGKKEREEGRKERKRWGQRYYFVEGRMPRPRLCDVE